MLVFIWDDFPSDNVLAVEVDDSEVGGSAKKASEIIYRHLTKDLGIQSESGRCEKLEKGLYKGTMRGHGLVTFFYFSMTSLVYRAEEYANGEHQVYMDWLDKKREAEKKL